MIKNNKILRFGIMTHGMVLSKWQYECIKLLNDSGIAELTLIINDASVSNSKNTLSKKIANYANKHLFYKLSSKYLFKVPAYEHFAVADSFVDVEVMACTTIKKGKFSEYFTKEDVSKIKDKNLDFILRFGFNIIKGDILEASKFGVWSYHHGNELKFRGGPTGYWEIYRHSHTNGVILQKLNNLIDAGVIINRRNYQTVFHSYSEHLNKLLSQSVDMPLQVCKQIISGDESNFNKEHSASKAPMNRLPNNWQMINFLFSLFVNRISFHIDRLFKQEHWDIGIVEKYDGNLTLEVNTNNIKWLKLRSGSKYAADSFCFESKNTTYIIFEDYDYSNEKGVLSLLKLDDENNVVSDKIILEKPYHLAYPFVFYHKNNIYLIPETAENGTIDLYIWDSDNEVFSYEKTLISIAGVDTSIVYHNEKWWLFCGIKNQLPNEKLYIYYSDELLGDYKPHLLNPVVVDPGGSRPAGQFITDNNVIYRPAQHSVKWYGEKINWYEIDELSPSKYHENYVGNISPQKSWKHNKGVHTFSQTSTMFVLDAKKRASGFKAFLAAVKQ